MIAPERAKLARDATGEYWNLLVDGRVEIEGETLTVCDNVRDALLSGRGHGECAEVARAIMRAHASEAAQ